MYTRKGLKMESREGSKQREQKGQREGNVSGGKKKILKTKSNYVLFMRDTHKAQKHLKNGRKRHTRKLSKKKKTGLAILISTKGDIRTKV